MRARRYMELTQYGRTEEPRRRAPGPQLVIGRRPYLTPFCNAYFYLVDRPGPSLLDISQDVDLVGVGTGTGFHGLEDLR